LAWRQGSLWPKSTRWQHVNKRGLSEVVREGTCAFLYFNDRDVSAIDASGQVVLRNIGLDYRSEVKLTMNIHADPVPHRKTQPDGRQQGWEGWWRAS